jgi:hypothetical protein
MTTQADASPAEGDQEIGLSRNSRLGPLTAHLAGWRETCADLL